MKTRKIKSIMKSAHAMTVLILFGTGTWLMHKLIINISSSPLHMFSENEQTAILLIIVLVLLAVLGQNFFKKYGK